MSMGQLKIYNISVHEPPKLEAFSLRHPRPQMQHRSAAHMAASFVVSQETYIVAAPENGGVPFLKLGGQFCNLCVVCPGITSADTLSRNCCGMSCSTSCLLSCSLSILFRLGHALHFALLPFQFYLQLRVLRPELDDVKKNLKAAKQDWACQIFLLEEMLGECPDLGTKEISGILSFAYTSET